ncbi:Uncharacterized HTH-type transcriptional regulator YddM [Phocoenobacter uteri]|uniref:Uncharacterized HTH-type transcriptional regulator YddM n=1 Tax=Phocoenobacter uteri TaxID=146806 RepID=A0A379CAE8_9PAST|nr:HigA family addiction module antitoxin [Phocoenobacter uteri]MDG6882504.1 transcriptional regulator [Phocoenobacter uteri]SUB58666.1 Uncharacterized HTH-type transcriptional regulator YddM [Phocoenobacter uteri]
MRMYNPAHPMAIVREDILPELNITITEAARQLGISRVTLSRLLNEKSGITPDMAIRLHKWLGRGPSPEAWLKMQLTYDLWQAEQKHKEYNVIPVKYESESLAYA